MSSVSAAPSPRISSGWARIAAAARSPPSSDSSRENAWAIRSRVSAYVTTPQPSTAVGIRLGRDLGRRSDLREHRLLEGCDGSL